MDGHAIAVVRRAVDDELRAARDGHPDVEVGVAAGREHEHDDFAERVREPIQKHGVLDAGPVAPKILLVGPDGAIPDPRRIAVLIHLDAHASVGERGPLARRVLGRKLGRYPSTIAA